MNQSCILFSLPDFCRNCLYCSAIYRLSKEWHVDIVVFLGGEFASLLWALNSIFNNRGRCQIMLFKRQLKETNLNYNWLIIISQIPIPPVAGILITQSHARDGLLRLSIDYFVHLWYFMNPDSIFMLVAENKKIFLYLTKLSLVFNR